jgi:excisionase family DNA binding protein
VVPEPLWTVSDVCKLSGFGKSWVYKQVEAGLIPCIRYGRAVRFAPEEIKIFFARRKKGGR